MRSTHRVCLLRASLTDLPGVRLKPTRATDVTRTTCELPDGGSAAGPLPRLPLMQNSGRLWWVSTPTHQNAEARTDDYRASTTEEPSQDIHELHNSVKRRKYRSTECSAFAPTSPAAKSTEAPSAAPSTEETSNIPPAAQPGLIRRSSNCPRAVTVR